MLLVLLKSFLLQTFLFVVILIVLIFVLLPLALATITVLRQQLFYYDDHNVRQHWYRRKQVSNNTETPDYSSFRSSAMYVGRVWHTRFLPIKHSFTYPLFIFGLNLDEIYYRKKSDTTSITTNNDVCHFQSILWPLSLIVSFNPNDRLKNGEGNNHMIDATAKKTNQDGTQSQNSFPDRILHLIKERTNGSFVPTMETHSIFLVTHLTYYGYCFNPVSFYYIHERATPQRLVCVIGEVSNTPWNEMYCYVLHPNSVDQVHCSSSSSRSRVDDANDDDDDDDNVTTSSQHKMETMKYIFPKQFHVSPFMEMNYNYEWTFTNFNIQLPTLTKSVTPEGIPSDHTKTTSIHVINSLRPIPVPSTKPNIQSSQPTTNIPSTNDQIGLQFSAVMKVHRYAMHPYRIVYYMIMYPMYCIIIQIWIHIQAFHLFAKGVSYQPHPLGSETSISRFIGTMMEPFFYVRDHYMKCTNINNGTKQQTLRPTSNVTTSVPNHKTKVS